MPWVGAGTGPSRRSLYDPTTGRRTWLPGHPAPSVQQMEDSFSRRTSYNEWIINDYDVKGLFAFRPIWLTPTKHIPLEQVVSDFPQYEGVHVLVRGADRDHLSIPCNIISMIKRRGV
jgi:hypothetical protein